MGEEPTGRTVYRVEFSDGSAYIGQTGRSALRRLSSHILATLSIQERIAGGLAVRLVIVASGLDEAEAARIEAAEIAGCDRPINVHLANGRTVEWRRRDVEIGAVAKYL